MTHEFQLVKELHHPECKRRKTISEDAKNCKKPNSLLPKNHGRHAKKRKEMDRLPFGTIFARATFHVGTEDFSGRSPPVMQTWCRSSAHKPGYAEVDLEVWNVFLPVN